MSKTTKRLIAAALVSVLGGLMTHLWYKLSDDNSGREKGAKKIAQLIRAVNDVQRKSSKKLIWQPALENEALYAGESIRTSGAAEARIKFEASGAIIDLDPDSAIVLEEIDGNIALDFVKGNILVKADSSGGAGADSKTSGLGLTLKSGGKNIALGKSEVSIGKSQGGELDLQVLKGQVTQDGKVVSQDELDGAKIRVLKPALGQPLYLNTKENEFAEFSWKPLPVGYKVTLEAGDDRETLKPVAGAEAPGETGTLKANIKLGKIYFRLVARSGDPKLAELSSSTSRIQVLAKIPPIPLSPESDAVVTINKNSPKVKLLWSNPAGFSKVILEVVTTPDFKQKVLRKDLMDASEYVFDVEKGGVYYWRVSGVLEGRDEVVSSKTQKFKIELLDELQPPVLEKPLANEKIPEDSAVKNGVLLSWKAASGAERYRVSVDPATPKAGTNNDKNTTNSKEGRQLQVSWKGLGPGKYNWSVVSIDAKGIESKPSEKREFVIQNLPVIEWADKKLKEDTYYLSLKPSMPLQWQTGESKSTSWMVYIEKEDGSEKTVTQKTKTSGGDFIVPKDGVYSVTVEGFDDRGQLAARSEVRRVRVSPAPLLPAPQFAVSTPEKLEATGAGHVRIEWQAVDGAKEYIVVIKNPDGTTAKETKFSDLKGIFRGLMPGDYNVALKAVDTTGRAGPEGTVRPLTVPNVSNVKAPKLKGLKVK